jgi:hypothetical protein
MALSWNELSTRLAEPFPAATISWRAGSVSRDKKRAQALPYAEPRVYEDRLNEVLGPDWSCRFITWGEQRLICELSVRVQDEAGSVIEITRTSTGEFDSGDRIAQGTAAEAQAFKRACSKFGLGRYLYDLPISWVGYDEASRRLTETPTLPERKPTPLQAEPPKAEPRVLEAPAEAKLSAKRADAMQRELEKLGFIPGEQRKLAEKVLGHRVKEFSELTETEALEVWNVARRSPPKAARAAGTPRAVGF